MSTITVNIDSNEQGTSRIAAFANVLRDDVRFSFGGYKSLDVDLEFVLDPEFGQAKFLCELKEPADYLQSAFGKTGHLYCQHLTMRENQSPCMILVLGGDDEISEAIVESTKTRYRGQERTYQIGSMEERLIDFEVNCEALRIPVKRWQHRPWRRLLSTVHKVLHGGNLTGYRPRPANGERDLVAASLLFPGMGPTLLAPIMEEYSLMLVPRRDDSRPISMFPKIGKKRLEMLDKRVAMVYGMAGCV